MLDGVPWPIIGLAPMFLLLALLLFIVLPSPWNVVGGLASVVLGVFEITYWQRRVRGQKVQTGVENLIGSTGEVTDPLEPSGQVRVLGELWEARSSSKLPRGSRVRVVAVHGLALEVEAIENAGEATTRAARWLAPVPNFSTDLYATVIEL
jgi:membrane protein implicated in regulation of membrane protease activity